jgi:hypothetical protein
MSLAAIARTRRMCPARRWRQWGTALASLAKAA